MFIIIGLFVLAILPALRLAGTKLREYLSDNYDEIEEDLSKPEKKESVKVETEVTKEDNEVK